jgi:hypothetical protein
VPRGQAQCGGNGRGGAEDFGGFRGVSGGLEARRGVEGGGFSKSRCNLPVYIHRTNHIQRLVVIYHSSFVLSTSTKQLTKTVRHLRRSSAPPWTHSPRMEPRLAAPEKRTAGPGRRRHAAEAREVWETCCRQAHWRWAIMPQQRSRRLSLPPPQDQHAWPPQPRKLAFMFL